MVKRREVRESYHHNSSIVIVEVGIGMRLHDIWISGIHHNRSARTDVIGKKWTNTIGIQAKHTSRSAPLITRGVVSISDFEPACTITTFSPWSLGARSRNLVALATSSFPTRFLSEPSWCSCSRRRFPRSGSMPESWG